MAASRFSSQNKRSSSERDSLTPCNMHLTPYNIYRLLNVYCELFDTSSYGKGRTSLRVRLCHMNECRICHNIHSITFLLYTFYIHCLISSVTYIRNQNTISANQPKNCFKFEITLFHLVSSYIFKTTPNGA